MAREGLPMDLRAAIAQAKQTGSMVTRERVRARFEGHTLDVTIQVIPLALPSPFYFHCVVLFVEVASPAGRGRADTRQLDSQLAQELEVTKQYLHAIIERYQTADEELQSANEEILVSYQELQSIKEELQTAKEERDANSPTARVRAARVSAATPTGATGQRGPRA
jgi:two-component system, chemotaxis family, CheB/CheR fusion protein